MGAVEQIHSIPARSQPAPCRTSTAPAHPRLRPYVPGYSSFRSGTGARIAHRLLPVALSALIIDLDAGYGLVTGPRSSASVQEAERWGNGLSVGLTPAGVSALLGVPARELTGKTIRLADLLGRRDAELVERLAAAPDWPTRFAVLDERLRAWSTNEPPGHGLIGRAWWRLQRDGAPARVGAVAAELGVSRRYLERGFRDQVGLSPATVARVARFQRAAWLLSQKTRLLPAAIGSGYADQPHFTREVRAMAGLTPSELSAFLQDPPVPAR